jgi:ribosomal protein S18 acetylase RimI-like enzyme
MSTQIEVEPLRPSDLPWAREFWREHWGAEIVVTRGRIHRIEEVEGMVARAQGVIAGLITYRVRDGACEVVSLDSLREGLGIGSLLMDAVRKEARRRGCFRLWLITTNDNRAAIRFYEKRGFLLTAVHRNAVEESRRLKPSIPLTGIDGIPIRDEVELEMLLGS